MPKNFKLLADLFQELESHDLDYPTKYRLLNRISLHPSASRKTIIKLKSLHAKFPDLKETIDSQINKIAMRVSLEKSEPSFEKRLPKTLSSTEELTETKDEKKPVIAISRSKARTYSLPSNEVNLVSQNAFDVLDSESDESESESESEMSDTLSSSSPTTKQNASLVLLKPKRIHVVGMNYIKVKTVSPSSSSSSHQSIRVTANQTSSITTEITRKIAVTDLRPIVQQYCQQNGIVYCDDITNKLFKVLNQDHLGAIIRTNGLLKIYLPIRKISEKCCCIFSKTKNFIDFSFLKHHQQEAIYQFKMKGC